MGGERRRGSGTATLKRLDQAVCECRVVTEANTCPAMGIGLGDRLVEPPSGHLPGQHGCRNGAGLCTPVASVMRTRTGMISSRPSHMRAARTILEGSLKGRRADATAKLPSAAWLPRDPRLPRETSCVGAQPKRSGISERRLDAASHRFAAGRLARRRPDRRRRVLSRDRLPLRDR